MAVTSICDIISTFVHFVVARFYFSVSITIVSAGVIMSESEPLGPKMASLPDNLKSRWIDNIEFTAWAPSLEANAHQRLRGPKAIPGYAPTTYS